MIRTVRACVGEEDFRHDESCQGGRDRRWRQFPWLSAADIAVAGVPTRALRVSFVGELGWELHAPMRQMERLYDALVIAGRSFGLVPFGAFAINAMRLEKGFRAWGSDLTSERTLLEAGLAHLVCTLDRNFVGREAMLERATRDDAWCMVLLELEADEHVHPFARHPVLAAGRPMGIVTSAARGHRTGKTLALAWLKPAPSATRDLGDELAVLVLDDVVSARMLALAPYDSAGRRMRTGRTEQE